MTRRHHGSVLIGAGAAALVLCCGYLPASAAAVPAPTTAATPPASHAVPHSSGFGSNWTVYHQNGLGTGVDPSGTNLRPLRSAWTSPQLDDSTYGEPLVYGGRVVVATENDTVYELAANTGKVLWARHLATAVPSGDLPCGDISPTVGITGTPVIDPGRNEIFVDADEMSGSGPSHHLYGLDVFTGAVELNQVVDPPGSVPANQLQRTGLALADGQVVMGFGGNDGDCNYYHGWLVAVPESGGKLRTFEVDRPSGDDEGAIWMGGAAPEVDHGGSIWVTTGNGSVTSSSPPWSNYDYSDGVVELSPKLAVEQFYAPASWPQDNADDADFAGSVALIGNFAFTASKSHNGYLLNRNHLGGVGHQFQITQFCNGDPDGGEASSGSTVYVPCGGSLTAVQIKASPASFKVLWQTSTGAGSPAIVASGLVWTIGNGNVYGLSPATGNAVVSEPLSNGEDNHFPTPTVADGLLLVPSSNQVDAWMGPAGLPPPPMKAPVAASYWVAASNGAVFPFGGAPALGSATGKHPRTPIDAFAATPDGKGYWLVDSVGDLFAFGDARNYGSTAHLHTKRIVGITPTPSGNGYWLVATDGGVFSFGDAKFHGSEGGKHLNRPIVGIAADPAPGSGYWMVASDGGIFAFDAPFFGSAGGIHLNRPIVGMTVARGGHGYRLVASDGGIFSYGQAPFYGSLGGHSPGSAVKAMAQTRDGRGYWMVDAEGGVFAFGDARFAGSPKTPQLVPPAVGIAAAG